MPNGFDCLRMFALGLLLLPSAVAFAAPRQLNCTMTQLESEADAEFSRTENRSITIETDEDAKTITVSQDGRKQALDHATFTSLTITGYTADTSLGLDRSSGNVVLQSYGAGSNKIEFGICASKAASTPSSSNIGLPLPRKTAREVGGI